MKKKYSGFKPKRKQSIYSERACVSRLILLIHEIYGAAVYSQIDMDSSLRVFHSPYDFALTASRKVIFCEAKMMTCKKPETGIQSDAVLKILSFTQKMAALNITISGTSYIVLLFKKPDLPDSKINFDMVRVQLLTANIIDDNVKLDTIFVDLDFKQTAKILWQFLL